MHAECRSFVEATLADHPPRTSCIEIGARIINGGVRDLLPQDCTYTGIDIADGPGVDVVADAATWKPERKVDLVLCLEVAEHTDQWQNILSNARTWLKRKGLLVVTAACDPRAPHSASDGGPIRPGEWYANIDPAELCDLLDGCDVVVDREAGDVRAVLVT